MTVLSAALLLVALSMTRAGQDLPLFWTVQVRQRILEIGNADDDIVVPIVSDHELVQTVMGLSRTSFLGFVQSSVLEHVVQT